MIRIFRHIAFFILVTIVVSTVAGQEVTEKRDIAVFGLEYEQYRVPPAALAVVDGQIRDVFVNLGRFNVIAMSYTIETASVSEFIQKIREYKERNVEIPETVRLGQEAFTEADFNRLVGSFIVVIPSVSFYETKRNDSGDYRTELETSFTFVNVERAETMSFFKIATSGTEETVQESVREAAEGIAPQLTFELRSIPEFRLKTGIIGVERGTVLVEFGRNMGVQRGDEYVIVEPRVLASGHTVEDEIGLLVVKDVEQEISYATIVYSSRRPRIGDQLQELPRVGFDTSGYVHLIYGEDATSVTPGPTLMGTFGVRQSTSRGFYNFRPFVGLEIPFSISGDVELSGFTANIFAGGELNWYLRRLQFVPAVALGIGGNVPKSDEEDFSISHVGGFAELTISFLISRDFRVFVDAGYSAWFGAGDSTNDTYAGITAGAGMTYKY